MTGLDTIEETLKKTRFLAGQTHAPYIIYFITTVHANTRSLLGPCRWYASSTLSEKILFYAR
jgi:hypothetical protein